MAAVICKPGQPVRWNTMYQLMADIMEDAGGDNSAGGELSPTYNKTKDETSPFSLDDVYQAAPALHLSLAGNQVVDVYLVQTIGDTSPWSLPEPLSTLASNKRLFFVAEEDGCFCTTIWKVIKNGGQFTLEKVPASLKMKCQSIETPEQGTSLPCPFIPQGAWANMQRRAYSARMRDDQQWTENKCLEAGGLMFSTSGGGIPWVQRSMTGYFTWNIAKEDLDQIYEAMYYAFIEWPCGFEKSKWWHHYDKDGTPGAGKQIEDDLAGPLTGDDWTHVWAWTAKLLSQTEESWKFASLPGCLEPVVTPYADVKLPWNVGTCNDTKRCPDQPSKLLVRCATFQTLDAIVKRLKATVVRKNCTASLRYYNSFQQGNALDCSLGGDENSYYQTITVSQRCTFDHINYTNCDYSQTISGTLRAWGGEDPIPEGDCTVDTADGCYGLGDCTDPPPPEVSTSGGGNTAGIVAAARGAAVSAGWIDGVGTTASMSVGNGTVNGNPFWGGYPIVVVAAQRYNYGYGSSGSYSRNRLKLQATSLASGHVFRALIKKQRNVYPDVGDPYVEVMSQKVVYIQPGETYTEDVPEVDDVFLSAEIWHDKAPT